jgi:preprotein translocase subunit SecA
MIDQVSEDLANNYVGDSQYIDDWDWAGLNAEIQLIFLLPPLFQNLDEVPTAFTKQDLADMLREKAIEIYKRRERLMGEREMRRLERLASLQVIDLSWREHLYEMDSIKEGIGLRAYGQKDPLIEYKSEGFRAFTEMLARVNEGVIGLVFKAQLRDESRFTARQRPAPARMSEVHDSADGMGFRAVTSSESAEPGGQPEKPGKKMPVVVGDKIGRNDPCPCGSGKKYKKCCGK